MNFSLCYRVIIFISCTTINLVFVPTWYMYLIFIVAKMKLHRFLSYFNVFKELFLIFSVPGNQIQQKYKADGFINIFLSDGE